MSWRDELQQGAFRGVPFQVRRDSQPAGQRTQVHEYPQRDLPSVEPLGKRTVELKLTAFVAGADCLAQRDKLLEAIEKPGPGELVHPWLGRMTVSVTDCTYSHDRRAMGVVSFELTFVQGGDDPVYPSVGTNAPHLLNGAADGVQASALARFTDALTHFDLSQVVSSVVLKPLDDILSNVRSLYGSVKSVTDSAVSVYDAIVSAPDTFAKSVFGAMDDVRGDFAGFYSRGQHTLSLFGLGNRADAISSLDETPTPAGAVNGAFVSSVKNLFQDAIATDVVRGVAQLPAQKVAVPVSGAVPIDGIAQRSTSVTVSDAGGVMGELLAAPSVEPPVADDVLTLRDDLSEALWSMAESSSAEHYQALADARSVSARHLTQVAKQGVALTTYNNPAPVPALVLAYRRYANAARAGDIVARNAVRHPGFVPAETLQLPGA